MLPNALVPLVTFFPFSLVGAIGVMAALDYLGFGLPPPTPSWGELLSQAQEFPQAWWLVLFPSFVIYVISMVGETNRAPFDLPECESELVSGHLTEYTGFRYAVFFLAEYINMATVSAIATTLPDTSSPGMGEAPGGGG